MAENVRGGLQAATWANRGWQCLGTEYAISARSLFCHRCGRSSQHVGEFIGLFKDTSFAVWLVGVDEELLVQFLAACS